MASNIKIKQGGGYAIEPGTLEFILKPDTNGSTLPSDSEVPIINTDTITSVAPGRYYIFWRNAVPDAFGQKNRGQQIKWIGYGSDQHLRRML
ncbi:hypothetical protein ACFFJX_12660 [Pseudarcicella hirudinis]|uniref:hypothetical protein n=1 Tax=Pseudarcicella hirudinis TaxID=1079859 RepID=UPI0035EFCE11